jgi:hypothetical protein
MGFFQKRPRRRCTVADCQAGVVNLGRHMRLCHLEASPIPAGRKGRKPREGQRQYKGKLQCSLCPTVTIRMDVHLKSVHKMLKGTGIFEKTLQESRMFVGSATTQDLHRALVDYGWVSLYFFISIACVSHISSMKVFSSCSKSGLTKTFHNHVPHRCENVTHNHSQYVIPGDIST